MNVHSQLALCFIFKNYMTVKVALSSLNESNFQNVYQTTDALFRRAHTMRNRKVWNRYIPVDTAGGPV